jgi:hypothetical protein
MKYYFILIGKKYKFKSTNWKNCKLIKYNIPDFTEDGLLSNQEKKINLDIINEIIFIKNKYTQDKISSLNDNQIDLNYTVTKKK